MVYIREAHPTDGWQLEANINDGVLHAQPRTQTERTGVATSCALGLGLTIPTLVDDMANTADRLFNGWPERLYILSPDGTVLYQGGRGPFGFNPDEWRQRLAEIAAR